MPGAAHLAVSPGHRWHQDHTMCHSVPPVSHKSVHCSWPWRYVTGLSYCCCLTVPLPAWQSQAIPPRSTGYTPGTSQELEGGGGVAGLDSVLPGLLSSKHSKYQQLDQPPGMHLVRCCRTFSGWIEGVQQYSASESLSQVQWHCICTFMIANFEVQCNAASA